jgi:hypothetical protein
MPPIFVQAIMTQIEILHPQTLPGFLESAVGVLLLAKSDCDACERWTTELNAHLASLDADDSLNAVRFAKIVLNQPGLGFFKKASPWLRDVNDLPFTAIYVDGEYTRGFIGGGFSGWSIALIA